MFMSGYPSSDKSCSDSYNSTEKCNGFNCYQIENTTSVHTNYMYYDFDVQEGQSGAPVIHGIEGSGPYTVYGLHKGSEGPYSYGLRLNSARYSSICSSLSNWTSVVGPNPSC